MPRVDGHHHLVLNFTDAASTHGQSVACSGAALTADVGNDRAMSSGGTLGTTPFTVTVGMLATEAAVFFESDAINNTLWRAGRWVMRLNVSTGNALVQLASVHFCRVNAAGVSQESLAVYTPAAPITLTTRIYNIAAVQGAAATALATDRVYVVVVLTNTDAAAQNISITPSHGIRTPILIETRIGNTVTGDMTAYATAYAGESGLTAATTWNLVSPTAEVRVTVDSQVDVRGGRLFPF